MRHHTFDYIELAAPDVAAAKRFYGDAFGWSFTDYGPDYTGIRRPGATERWGVSTRHAPRAAGFHW
jgi:uncharacterized protein